MRSKKGWSLGLTPVLLALPFAAAMGFAAIRYGSTIRKLIFLAIKLVVTK